MNKEDLVGSHVVGKIGAKLSSKYRPISGIVKSIIGKDRVSIQLDRWCCPNLRMQVVRNIWEVKVVSTGDDALRHMIIEEANREADSELWRLKQMEPKPARTPFPFESSSDWPSFLKFAASKQIEVNLDEETYVQTLKSWWPFWEAFLCGLGVGVQNNDKEAKLCSGIIRDFMKRGNIRLGGSFDNAYNRQWNLSTAFWMFARGSGANARVLGVFNPKFEITSEKYRKMSSGKPGSTLVWFEDEGLAVDWTARQFREDAPHPMVMNKEMLEATWDHIGW